MADQEDPKLAIFRVLLTYSSCLLAILVYDWLLSVKQEWRYIWRTQFSIVSALYVFIRYFEIVREAVTVYLAANSFTPEQCAPWGRWQVYSTLPMTAAVSTLFTLRVWALYDRSKIVLICLGSCIAGLVVLSGIAGEQFGPPVFLEGKGPCFAGPRSGASNIVIVLWLCPFLYDLLLTVLLIARAFIIRKRGGQNKGGILGVLVRDGLAYFMLLSFVNLLNVAFYLQTAKPSIQSVNSGMAFDVASLVSCRLILSLRKVADMDHNTPSHGVYNAAQAAAKHNAGGHGVSRVIVDGPWDYVQRGEKGLETHIALDTFGNSYRKGDEESLEDNKRTSGSAPMTGVFVLEERAVHVDL